MSDVKPQNKDVPTSNAEQSTPVEENPPQNRVLTHAELAADSAQRNPFTIKDIIFQGLLFYAASYGVSYFVQRNGNSTSTAEPTPVEVKQTPDTYKKREEPNADQNDQQEDSHNYHQTNKKAYDYMVPYWRKGTDIDVFLYITTKDDIENEILTTEPTMMPVWSQYNVKIGSEFDFRSSVEIPLTNDILEGNPINAIVFMKKHNANIVPNTPGFKMDDIVIKSGIISKTSVFKKDHTKRNLIGMKKNDDIKPEDAGLVDGMPYMYMHPNLTISLVDTSNVKINLKTDPDMILRWIHSINSDRIVNTRGEGAYSPVIYFNDFWHLKEHMYRVNTTNPTIKIDFDFSSLSFTKFQMYCSFQANMDSQLFSSGGDSVMSNTFDMMKKTLLETSPYLLIVTAIVTVLHSIFDFLAFKNDVQFWRKKKDHAGLSFRSLILGLFFEVVIFLYLIESMEETSKVILISNGIGLAISTWKIFKAVDFKVQRSILFARPVAKEDNTPKDGEKSSLIDQKSDAPGPPADRKVVMKLGSSVLTVKEYSSYSQIESDTNKYDKIAFKYLSWVAYPLMFGYIIYSLIYKEFNSWYSFILSVLVGYVYTFGFIAMTPQLYINYKLKSVAHMPWRTFIYKSLNTFIDDLFAFVMPMPMLHRIATLRDDVIFFIYLYQRYIYRVDPNRVNEFGQVGEEDEQKSTGTLESSKAKVE
ncbi:hypothetical protein BB561_000789 [Smittium simulii]|uniref:Cleft lip and palate transmembrane 1 n=1 Tax=Smittium simulii TaxID=133385 RepID=A0A2T9YXK7_9FUNG|nr:hypothetical protein BB561_000789 [Smittium simulii]